MCVYMYVERGREKRSMFYSQTVALLKKYFPSQRKATLESPRTREASLLQLCLLKFKMSCFSFIYNLNLRKLYGKKFVRSLEYIQKSFGSTMVCRFHQGI